MSALPNLQILHSLCTAEISNSCLSMCEGVNESALCAFFSTTCVCLSSSALFIAAVLRLHSECYTHKHTHTKPSDILGQPDRQMS